MMKEEQAKWAAAHPQLVAAIQESSWKTVHRIEGATAYQILKWIRLKHNRLRLWAGPDRGFQCGAAECAARGGGGTSHLTWSCPETQICWKAYAEAWGLPEETGERSLVRAFFALDIGSTPQWPIAWGEQHMTAQWESLREEANTLWALGCAVVVTYLWRRNIDRLHGDAGILQTQGLAAGCRKTVMEAYLRFRSSYYPLTPSEYLKLAAATQILQRWTQRLTMVEPATLQSSIKVGFFAGGSRGNPGPGGSGCVVFELDKWTGEYSPVWAAATALGRPSTTNNVAEFVGLQRLLAHAHAKGWRELHIVGKSLLILRMMDRGVPLKSTELLHWYRLTRRLADVCHVQSWTHHYMRHNKTADWLANLAMDLSTSKTTSFDTDQGEQAIERGVAVHADGDVTKWFTDWDTQQQQHQHQQQLH